MSLPKISVVMPVYNAAKYLPESIKSILNQTFSDFEFLILNDASTDESLEIIYKFQKIDSRIVVLDNTSNAGPAAMRNKGFELAKGEYIALMDADDISENTRFEKQIGVLKNKKIDLCATNYTKFGDSISDQYVKHFEFHKEIRLHFLFDCYIANPTIMMRKEIIKGLKYNPSFFPVDDYEFLSRLILNNTFYNIQESLLKYRWHNTNISQSKKVDIANLTSHIRKKQYEEIDPEIDPNYIKWSFETDGKRFPEEILEIIKTQEKIKKDNLENLNFDPQLLNLQMEKTLLRTIKKVKKPNWDFYLFIKKNNYLKKLKITDQTKIFFKSIFSF